MSKATIKIPRPLYNNLNKLIEDTGFNSVTEFIVYVMRDLVSTKGIQDKEAAGSENIKDSPADEKGDNQNLTQEEIRMVKKRLENLGYL